MKQLQHRVSLSVVATIGVLVMTAMIVYLPFKSGKATSVRSAAAGATAKAARSGQPLKNVLNSDGSLNLATGFSGSLDVRGYRMEYGTNGTPRFAPTATALAPGDEYWDSQFSLPGPVGTVHAIAVSGNDIYVGGNFNEVGGNSTGGITATSIAKWDGNSWSALGSGVSKPDEYPYVFAIAINGSDVYAGGTSHRRVGLPQAVLLSGMVVAGRRSAVGWPMLLVLSPSERTMFTQRKWPFHCGAGQCRWSVQDFHASHVGFGD